MITCPACYHQEILGALFCSECGYILAGEPGKQVAEGSLSLLLIDHDHEIELGEVESLTLGRVDEGQSIIPDIDLSAHKAFENGVSRLHATIKIGGELTITDLGSSNGTYINGERLEAYIPHPFSPDDIFTLGKMDMHVIIKE
jgi:predicted component of type VI protein secretion system